MATATTVCPLASVASPMPPGGRDIDAFYFGNSLAAHLKGPQWHPEIVNTTPDTWDVERFFVTGARLSQLWTQMHDVDPDPQVSTVTPKGQAARDVFENGSWNVAVLQPYGSGLVWEPAEGGHPYGDVYNGGLYLDWMRQHQPGIRPYMYQTWPQAPSLPPEQLDPNIPEADQPDFSAFEYDQSWDGLYNFETDFRIGNTWRTRHYHELLIDAWNDPAASWNVNHPGAEPVLMIPVGDVLYEIQQRAKAGTLLDSFGQPITFDLKTATVTETPGGTSVDVQTQEDLLFDDVEWFYHDWQHQRTGLPRYVATATFYTTLFGRHPDALDYTPYNRWYEEPGSYIIENQDHQSHIPITPELAALFNDIVWDVVHGHPYTEVLPEPGTAGVLVLGAGLLASRRRR